jgi:hypothetical protein
MPIIWDTLVAMLSSGLVVRLLDDFRNQRKFVATIIALRTECNYNRQHRGNQQSPFKIKVLEQATDFLELHEQCPDLAEKCLRLLELCHDANSGQISRRKYESGAPMQPGTVQELFEEALNNIDALLPNLKKGATLAGCFRRSYLWLCIALLLLVIFCFFICHIFNS